MEKKDLIPEEHDHKKTADFARSHLPSEDDLFELAELFKVFSDSTRIRIMCALSETEMCVYDIAELLGASQSAVSHQLRLLRASHLVRTRRDGKNIFYALDDAHVDAIISMGLEHIRHTKGEKDNG